MKKFNLFLIIYIIFMAQVLTAAAALTVDPYEVYFRYYKAIGGLEKIKKQESLYYEAKIIVSGLQGTMKEWIDYTSLHWASDIDLQVYRQRRGFNGSTAWIVDTNNKLQVQKDAISEKKRRLRKHMERLAFLDRESPLFKLTYKGREKIAGQDCHVLQLTNTINNDILIEYFHTGNNLKMKSILKDGDGEEHTLYSDYRPVKGILRPFSRDITVLPSGQKQEIRVLKYEIDTPLSAEIFNPPAKDAADFVFTKGKSAGNIPFEFIENHIYLKVTIKGKKGLWILDSGAAISVMDFDYARQIGLEPAGRLRGQGAGNRVDLSFVTMPAYSLPGIRFEPQKIGCLNLKQIVSRFLGFDIAGILGYDFLSRFVTRIDYAAGKLSFYHPDYFVYKGAGRSVTAPLRGNLHSLPLTVDGKYSGLWALDLGANGLSFHHPYAMEHNLPALKGIETMAAGAGGMIKEKAVRFSSIELAGFVVSKPRISFPVEEVTGGFSSGEFIGNAGNTLFRHFILYLDYKNQQVIVEKGADFDRDFPENNSGLWLIVNDRGGYEVLYIIPGSAAEKAGFRKGDIVKSIAGKDAAAYPSLVKLRELFYREPGTTYAVEVERQGKLEKLSLILFSPFDQLEK